MLRPAIEPTREVSFVRRVSSKRLWLELQRLADDRGPLQVEGVSDRGLSDEPTRLGMPGAFRLDGAPGHPGLGENSFAGHTPLLTLALHDSEWQLLLSARRMVAFEPFDAGDPFGPLRRTAAILHRPGDPPFSGAMIGYVTYELGERLLEVSSRPLTQPHALFFVEDTEAIVHDVRQGARLDDEEGPGDQGAQVQRPRVLVARGHAEGIDAPSGDALGLPLVLHAQLAGEAPHVRRLDALGQVDPERA